jgi:hypothetical protein
MLNNHTHERLAALGLAGMAKAFDDQQRQPDVTALTFEQRLGLMIDREATERENKRLIVRLKFASLGRPQSSKMSICALRAASIAPSLPSSSMAIGSAASKICSSPGRPASARAGSPAHSATRHAAIIDPSYIIACQGCSKLLRSPAATDAMRGSSDAIEGRFAHPR